MGRCCGSRVGAGGRSGVPSPAALCPSPSFAGHPAAPDVEEPPVTAGHPGDAEALCSCRGNSGLPVSPSPGPQRHAHGRGQLKAGQRGASYGSRGRGGMGSLGRQLGTEGWAVREPGAGAHQHPEDNRPPAQL